MKMVKHWNISSREDAEHQFFKIFKIKLYKALSNLM